MRHLPLTLLIVLTIIWSLTSPSNVAAGGLRDEATYECVYAYYGIGQPINYTKAYQCFDSHAIYEYLIVMQLNGEGVPADPKKAEDLMHAWLKADPENAGSVDETHMQQLIKDRLRGSTPSATKIDFCKDAAESNYAIGYCTWVQELLDKQDADKAMGMIRSKLTPNEAAIWDQIMKAFETYLEAEGVRARQLYAGGSAAGTADTGQQIYVRKNFQEFMQSTFGKMNLAPSSKDELEKTEADMQAAYDANISEYEETYSPPEKTNNETADETEYRETMTNYVAEYKEDAAVSQKRWVALRDLCAKLAVLVYKDKYPNVDWVSNLDRALSLVRIEEIRNRPLGG
jgi:hypothetical protein